MKQANADLEVKSELDPRSAGIQVRMAGKFNVEYNGRIMRPVFFICGESEYNFAALGLYLVPDDISVDSIAANPLCIDAVDANKDTDQAIIDFEEFIVSLGCIPVECEVCDMHRLSIDS